MGYTEGGKLTPVRRGKIACFACPGFVNRPIILKYRTPLSTNKRDIYSVEQVNHPYHIGKILRILHDCTENTNFLISCW